MQNDLVKRRDDLVNTREMAGRMDMGVIGCLLVVAALLRSATADTYVVLGNLRWSVPTNGDDGAYRMWAAGQDFEIGDTLGGFLTRDFSGLCLTLSPIALINL
ncbi:hypothetical protein IFM89_008310 [Coptis chinensis]|uniref:Phytocyanin domain-containing protein n=1 Tax=Coptis chinensis TaxID=261450 RepID=A0A835LYY0_9MAGN|nr:hypothetical protein IFM89_008310 [Coptis chinensis]